MPAAGSISLAGNTAQRTSYHYGSKTSCTIASVLVSILASAGARGRKNTCKFFIYACSVLLIRTSTGGLIFGYDIGVTGGVIANEVF